MVVVGVAGAVSGLGKFIGTGGGEPIGLKWYEPILIHVISLLP